MNLHEAQTFAIDLAHQAGDIMRQHFHASVEHHEKDDKTIVTIADEAINQLVIDEVAKAYPGTTVFGEEGSAQHGSDYAWVCDPIDGTVPFAKGLPVSAFSLALVHQGQPVLGVVYDPAMDRLYTAIKGEGAYLNDQRIHVSRKPIARHAIINVEWWAEAEYDVDTPLHQLSLDTKAYILHLGCIVNAACLVAAGQYEAAVYGGGPGKNVDIAAVKVIVEEAGGCVTDLRGQEQRYDQPNITGAIISNGHIHQQLVDRLGKVVS